MGLWSDRVRTLALVFWVCAAVAIVVWPLQPGYVVGWDVNVYRAALNSLKIGHDPYVDAMTVQRVYHAKAIHPAGSSVPYSYVYSPITLPLLAAFGHLPVWLAAALYWLVLGIAVGVTLAVGWWTVRPHERRVFALLMPLMVFFPGLLESDEMFSGNVAYILYGLVLACAWRGWTRKQWVPFYIAVVLASCVKAPLLSLLIIAPLSARRQWLPTGVAAAAGVALFAMQPHVWPQLFRNYLMAVELQFDFNRDFSASPAGLMANGLFNVVPYKITSAVTYAVTAVLVGGVMLTLRRKFLAGAVSLKRWVPLVMVGAVLLNPRIMEYDMAPVTVPMALLAWRTLARKSTVKRTALLMAVFFVCVNGSAANYWHFTACMTMLVVFAGGAWDIWKHPGEMQPRDQQVTARAFGAGGMVAA